LNLSKIEFKKLWQRFDLNNCGGVNTQVFLRLLDYNANRIEKLSEQTDMLRAKSFFIQKRTNRTSKRNRKSHQKDYTSKSFANESKNKNEETSSRKQDMNIEEQNENNIEKYEVNKSGTHFVSEIMPRSNEELKNERTNCETSMSDSKIKTVIQTVRQSNKFGSNRDLVTFLNQKLNESYIFMKTAFEYIDNEQLGHLFIDEFKSVLDEFNLDLDQKAIDSILAK
jgi:hypothetical protein